MGLTSSEIESIALPSLQQLPQIMAASHLDGTNGSNREDKNKLQIRAHNDYEALQCWLNEYRHQATTFRHYQKEAERFLLWSIYQQQKSLSSLDRDDLEAYGQFLDNPQPAALWCSVRGGRGHKRGTPQWRPFKGPLKDSAKITALSIIDSMLTYLVEARYLAFNPLSLIKKSKNMKKQALENNITIHERILEVDEWYALLDTLDNLPETSNQEKLENARLKLLVSLLYFLGLRINELATHHWSAFKKVDDQWWFFVNGKGNKLAKIPVNNELLRIIISYRAIINRSPFPKIDEKLPLISSINNTGKAITARQMNKLLKRLAIITAEKFNQPDKKNKLMKFSAHWLRHLSASMQDRAGISFNHIRSNMRHENDNTTRLYVHALDKERHDTMQQLKFKIITSTQAATKD